MSDLERKDSTETGTNISTGDISSNNTSVGDIIGDDNTIIVKDTDNIPSRKFTIDNKIAIIAVVVAFVVPIVVALIQTSLDSNGEIPSSFYESSVVSQEPSMSESESESTSTVTSIPEVSRGDEQSAESTPQPTPKPAPQPTPKPTSQPTPMPTIKPSPPTTKSPTASPKPEPLKEYSYQDLKSTESRAVAETFGIVKTEDGGYSQYSDWSGWGDDFIENTDLCDVGTQIVDTSYTLYWYWRFHERSTGIYWSYAKSGTVRENHYTFSPLTVTRPAEFGNVTIYYDGEVKHSNAWFINTDWPTEIIPAEKIQYKCRTRNKIVIYFYWDDDWSDWSTTEVVQTEERRVKTR